MVTTWMAANSIDAAPLTTSILKGAEQYPLIPPPNLGAVPQQWQLVCTIVCAVLAGISLVWLIVEAKRWKTAIPVLLWIGAGLSMHFEPIYDNFNFLIYPHDGMWVAVESFGRKIPWYDGLGYFFYFSVPMWIIMKRFILRAADRWFWGAFVVLIVWTIGNEIPFMSVGMWTYYGDQFTIGGFPAALGVWCSPCLFGGAWVFYKLRNWLTGWRVWLVLPLMPMIILGFSCAIIFPYTTALHMPANHVIRFIGGSLTVLFSILTIWMLLQFRERPESDDATRMAIRTA